MKIAFLDDKGKAQMLEGFDCISDDGKWLVLISGRKRQLIRKTRIFEQTYVIYQ